MEMSRSLRGCARTVREQLQKSNPKEMGLEVYGSGLVEEEKAP
jgi:hypothetical protein